MIALLLLMLLSPIFDVSILNLFFNTLKLLY
jgi:hypothetical protein